MRADRLISILMLLQIYKKLTASELSKKLEVSVRTIYRDIDTLSGIGVPIVTEKGINGGIKLLGDYKTSLTGINKNELLSLFIPTGDKILEDLGVENLKDSTILKILGNSSPNDLKEFENIQNYIYIDMYTWNKPNNIVNTNILSILQNAIWNSKSLKILYRKIYETKEVELNPLGLVCKRGTWYLVAVNNRIIKTYKVTSIESALLMTDTFIRPYDFNLKSYWRNSTSNFKSLIPKYTFTFKVSPYILNHIKERQFITISETMYKENGIYLKIKFDAIWQGVEFAFGYGKSIEIIEPIEAISEIKKKALEVIDLY
ncbi:WYL domain-containing protein [Clostridium botulinum]|uniref:WYL domain-containing transcriptional regulator n=2 Tax=Clostridium botulinum TaxID=1491 RepID=A0A846I0C5_CLOBO|nr:WYL domain-containing protein [Clostridium botulinum]AJD26832.1 deoR-like helix-turn-helix domain protein [Clostridium botulinum CDC_297]ACQ54451.1 transcription regulator [Clostridium botulinum Ba4 str. 657]AJE12404.1 deoR-like helix-turn-helix domain protein [Clostridium botulinum CDC_1436]APR01146.1 deoR-like helix-turn-helix domain protein [Clostridium botulinum]APU59753.1 deoR-like helix-turn-helix domain protein [Clostridium botulinum]